MSRIYKQECSGVSDAEPNDVAKLDMLKKKFSLISTRRVASSTELRRCLGLNRAKIGLKSDCAVAARPPTSKRRQICHRASHQVMKAKLECAQ